MRAYGALPDPTANDGVVPTLSQVWGDVIPVTARTGTAEDKRRVWPMMVKQWPGYADYQAGTQRDIPVVLLRPR